MARTVGNAGEGTDARDAERFPHESDVRDATRAMICDVDATIVETRKPARLGGGVDPSRP